MNVAVSTQFRGEDENQKAGFTNGMEKVEGTRIGRGVVDVQELSGIARAVKSLSVEVNTFVSAGDDEFHRSGSAHYFTMARRVWKSDRHSLVFTMLARLSAHTREIQRRVEIGQTRSLRSRDLVIRQAPDQPIVLR